MSTPNVNTENFEFRAEMKQLLNLIVHSLYTHPEVFLRELVSNSSDALNKIRFRKLTDQNIISPDEELKINITVDKENSTFTIEDTGIGMTRDELVNNLGTIAKSGTFEFLSKVKEQQNKIDGQLIGQFGVGFYSVFMVTDEVVLETRHAEQGSTGLKWTSKGESSFTIEETDKENRGTKITFKLKDEYKEFAEDWKIKSTLQKYSNFVDFPVYVGEEKVNKVTALWHRNKSDITEEELNEFYKFFSNDFDNPLGHLHLDIEGAVNFKSLIFVPSNAPLQFTREDTEKTLHLYSSKVFIRDDAKELLPEYLRFVKGVVDTEDLPLNVSREMTQKSPVMAKISNILTGKILGMLQEWADSDKEKYNNFYKNFGSLFVTGVNTDYTNRDKIIELLRFKTSQTKKEELTDFNGYVSRMKSDAKEIYYVSGNSVEQIEKNPNLEYFRSKDIEVIYLTDPVEIFTLPYVNEYDGKKIVSIDKADIDLSKDEEKPEKLKEELATSLIDVFKQTLGDKVEDVIESKRLVESPATLVVGKEGMDPQMEKMMQIMNKDFTASKKILEINTSHRLIKNLSRLNLADSSNPLLRSCVLQIYDGALILEGQIKSPGEFVSRMNEIMLEATK
jgi:molecular chaperone HtpG